MCRIGAFGDVCLALPVVDALSAHFEVDWLIREGHDAILSLFPDVHCGRVLFSDGTRASLVSRIESARYDALLDFSNWAVVGDLARRVKSIPIRAIAYDAHHRFFLQRAKYALPWYRPFNRVVEIDGRVHRVAKWQRLVQSALGCDLSLRWALPPIRSPDERLRVFVHPHASKPEKRWPMESYLAVLRTLKPASCLINEGRGAESATSEQLAAGLRGAGIEVGLVPLAPSFVRLRDALREVHFALGSDSGPMHLASLLGVPSVVIYGPSSPTEVAPLWRAVTVYPPSGPGPIERVTPAMVLDGITRLLARSFDRP